MCKTLVIRLASAILLWCVMSGTMAVADEPGALQTVTQNGVVYLSGGIGSDEAQAMRALASDYKLRVMFAGTDGEYLSDIDVRVASMSDTTILAMQTQGPLLYINLPAGRYRITASTEHGFQTRWVNVPTHGGIDANFYWHDEAPVRGSNRCGACHRAPA
jgi:hypothetical protein